MASGEEADEAVLAREVGVSPLLARLLVNRGVRTPHQADAMLRARLSEHLRSPMLFRDMRRAAERLVRAVDAGETVGIYGDYDVDGISGSALLIRFFRALGREPVVHVPHRLRDGYGVREGGVRQLAERGARVMITVDCGGVSHAEIALANRLGMDVVVCDHHQVAAEPLPALAVLNPIEPGSGFPFSGLCGAGLAFYLASGVRMVLRERGGRQLPDLRRDLDLVALGSIADVVPLIEENRVLVKHGLREIAASQRPGIVALKAVSGVQSVSSASVGFRLAPRLNAGGRLADAGRSVELLTTADRERAERLAVELDGENRTRQGIERQMVSEAAALVEARGGVEGRHCIVLASPDWHPGVVGIVAARMVERYARPTVLVAVDAATAQGRGSGRSVAGVNLHAALQECAPLLSGFGGHPMAAGLSIDATRVDALAARLEEVLAGRTRPEDFVLERRVDCELPLPALGAECMADIERLEPCGAQNPEPTFLARGARVRARSVVGGQHLKLSVEQGGRSLQAIGFGLGDFAAEAGAEIDLLYTPMISEWGGNRTLELRIRDLKRRV